METVEEFIARGGKITQVPVGVITENAALRKKPNWIGGLQATVPMPMNLTNKTYGSRRATCFAANR